MTLKQFWVLKYTRDTFITSVFLKITYFVNVTHKLHLIFKPMYLQHIRWWTDLANRIASALKVQRISIFFLLDAFSLHKQRVNKHFANFSEYTKCLQVFVVMTTEIVCKWNSFFARKLIENIYHWFQIDDIFYLKIYCLFKTD